MIKANLIGFKKDRPMETIHVANQAELQTHIEKIFEGQDVKLDSQRDNLFNVTVDGNKEGEVEVIAE